MVDTKKIASLVNVPLAQAALITSQNAENIFISPGIGQNRLIHIITSFIEVSTRLPSLSVTAFLMGV